MNENWELFQQSLPEVSKAAVAQSRGKMTREKNSVGQVVLNLDYILIYCVGREKKGGK